jgi:hypothetical protein
MKIPRTYLWCYSGSPAQLSTDAKYVKLNYERIHKLLILKQFQGILNSVTEGNTITHFFSKFSITLKVYHIFNHFIYCVSSSSVFKINFKTLCFEAKSVLFFRPAFRHLGLDSFPSWATVRCFISLPDNGDRSCSRNVVFLTLFYRRTMDK